MKQPTIKIRQNDLEYALQPQGGETAEEAVLRELGWAFRSFGRQKHKSFRQVLASMNWELVVETK